MKPLKRSKMRLLQSKLRQLRSVQLPMMAQLVVKKIPYLEKLLLSKLRQIRSVPTQTIIHVKNLKRYGVWKN